MNAAPGYEVERLVVTAGRFQLLTCPWRHKVDKTLYLTQHLRDCCDQHINSNVQLPKCNDKHKGSCKKAIQCEPMVPPNNAAHLSVNWKTDQKHTKEIEVTLVKESVKKNTIKEPPNKKGLLMKQTPVNHIL